MDNLIAEMRAQRELHEKQLQFERERFEAERKSAAEERAAHQKEMKELVKMIKSSGSVPNEPSSLCFFRDISQRVPQFVFDPDAENCFSTWYDRYKGVFTVDAADLGDEEKVRALLERLDSSCYAKYKSYILPKAVEDCKYDETIASLKQLLDKSLSMFTQRYQLLRFEKDPNDDLLSYCGQINELCEKTDIGNVKTDEWKALFFIFGLKQAKFNDLRQRLMMVMDRMHKDGKPISLKTVYEESEMYIGTQRDARLIGSSPQTKVPSESPEVCAVAWTCWNCGRSHDRGCCPKPKVECFKCHEKGHLARFCRSKSEKPFEGQSSSGPKRRANQVKVDEFNVYSCVVSKPQKVVDATMQMKVQVNGTEVRFRVDTGAEVTLISEADWRRMNMPPLQSCSVKINGPTGVPVKVLGKLACSFKLNGISSKGNAYVTRGKSVFGMDWIVQCPVMHRLAMDLVANECISSVENSTTSNSIERVDVDDIETESSCTKKPQMQSVVEPTNGQKVTSCGKSKDMIGVNPSNDSKIRGSRGDLSKDLPLLKEDENLKSVADSSVMSKRTYPSKYGPALLKEREEGNERFVLNPSASKLEYCSSENLEEVSSEALSQSTEWSEFMRTDDRVPLCSYFRKNSVADHDVQSSSSLLMCSGAESPIVNLNKVLVADYDEPNVCNRLAEPSSPRPRSSVESEQIKSKPSQSKSRRQRAVKASPVPRPTLF
jgi:hypothetical protein